MINFSVILPIHFDVSYNTFKKAFNSLIKQTLKPNEFIVKSHLLIFILNG